MSRFCGATRVTSLPAITTTPSSRASRPAMERNSVDLPEPDGPSSAVSSPEGISMVTSSSAAKLP
ncbi:Uncharacterised protein [Mycobacteroides abscessus subsp. abscessus]|nr:Uncharacterised protein [Mycobacteroides abscessus subsp. abscessus]